MGPDDRDLLYAFLIFLVVVSVVGGLRFRSLTQEQKDFYKAFWLHILRVSMYMLSIDFVFRTAIPWLWAIFTGAL